MYKKACFVLVCLTLLALLSVAPALAGMSGGPVASPSSQDVDRANSWLGGCLTELFDWFSAAFIEADGEPVATVLRSSDDDEEPEEPGLSGPDLGISPKGGPHIDPDG